MADDDAGEPLPETGKATVEVIIRYSTSSCRNCVDARKALQTGKTGLIDNIYRHILRYLCKTRFQIIHYNCIKQKEEVDYIETLSTSF